MCPAIDRPTRHNVIRERRKWANLWRLIATRTGISGLPSPDRNSHPRPRSFADYEIKWTHLVCMPLYSRLHLGMWTGIRSQSAFCVFPYHREFCCTQCCEQKMYCVHLLNARGIDLVEPFTRIMRCEDDEWGKARRCQMGRIVPQAVVKSPRLMGDEAALFQSSAADRGEK